MRHPVGVNLDVLRRPTVGNVLVGLGENHLRQQLSFSVGLHLNELNSVLFATITSSTGANLLGALGVNEYEKSSVDADRHN